MERSKARACIFPATTPNSRSLADRSGRTERLCSMSRTILAIDYEQSLFFLLSSSSRGKTLRTPARGNLGKEKQEKRVFRVPAFAMSFHGSTNSRGKIRTACSQSILATVLRQLKSDLSYDYYSQKPARRVLTCRINTGKIQC